MGTMNELIDKATVLRLRRLLGAADPDRPWTAVEASADLVDGLQLRARSDLVAAAILTDNSADSPVKTIPAAGMPVKASPAAGSSVKATPTAGTPAQGRPANEGLAHGGHATSPLNVSPVSCGATSGSRAVDESVGRNSIRDQPGTRTSARERYARLAVTVRRALRSPELSGWMIWPVSEAVTSSALDAWKEAEDAGDLGDLGHPRAPDLGVSRDSRDSGHLSQPGDSGLPDGTRSTGGNGGNGGTFDDGLHLISELTPRLTGEFAIRRFLAADLDRAIDRIQTWTFSSDEHVRRLASEGTRPFLPWAVRVAALTSAPRKALPILHALRGDPSEYVRRSVANHLNDLSRQHPELVVQVASQWLRDADEYTMWVVRHGLRTLIKKAHPGALALMGFSEATLRVSPIGMVDETVVLPGNLDFSFTVTNDADVGVRLAIDYVVSYVKSSGALADKVFKLTTRDLAPGGTIELRKRHAIRQMTTRVHYPGEHLLELQINGRRYSRRSFEVEVPGDVEIPGGATDASRTSRSRR